ncbi:MAG: CZB domain-containing protein, partial [Candidatus Eremiobacteraeota bacterium]|nr:CZB domain-containing protein [Candidatus Eremiobacteraeota bacterium]
ESGRGFAVVAGEVKNLAQQTDRATKDIETIVGRIQNEVLEIASSADLSQKAVRDGQSSVNSVAEDIGGVKSRVDEIVAQIATISQLFSEHRAAGKQVATSVVDITHSNQAALEGVQEVAETMNALERTILDQLDELSRLELPGKVVQLAKSDHVIWKKRLAMMAVGQLQLDPKELADHHSCRLGRWYDQQCDSRLTKHPAFGALADPHQRVHAHGIRAAQLMKDGQAEAANRELTLMEKASVEVMQHLTDLERTARGE